MKALVLENIHPIAVEVLEARGYEVELRTGALSRGRAGRGAATASQLLGIRSNTTVTERVLDGGARPAWRSAASASAPTRSTSAAAAERGIAVFNAPYSNTRSVVELVIGEIIALARRLPEKTQRMHDGVWDKSAQGSHEVRGRTLGIVGYGNIGTQLSNVAEALGHAGGLLRHRRPARARQRPPDARRSTSCSPSADVVTLHVDGRPGQRRASSAPSSSRR